jgi:hypothetical protein
MEAIFRRAEGGCCRRRPLKTGGFGYQKKGLFFTGETNEINETWEIKNNDFHDMSSLTQ